MLTITYKKSVATAGGTQVAWPGGLKTLSDAEAAAIPAVVTVETITIDDGNENAILALMPAGAIVHQTSAQLASQYTLKELSDAIGARLASGGN